MDVVGLGWLGTRTTASGELADFYARVLGLELTFQEPGFWVFGLPDGHNVEVFDPARPGKEHFDTGPVGGFAVSDLPAAVGELRAAGVELLGDAGPTWQHFRAPDGNVYELVQAPGAALVVTGYDPSWADRGARLVADLGVALRPAALRVEHIGSTAIPGMAAKPVYDLQISVADLDAAAASFDGPLAAFGLARRPWEQDHVPAGCADPPERWAKRLWNKPEPGGERIIVHCRLAGSPNERLALLFRDWFRAHPQAVPAYARFKQELAAATGDLEVYTDVKDPVVDLVVAVAEQWAAETGWTVAPPARTPPA